MVKENTMKQTEIGLLPDDWEVVYWTDVFDFKSTSSYSRAEINETGIFGYFHYGDIHTKIGSLLNPNVYVSGFIEKSQLKNYTLIKKGDLIIADASEDYSGVGKGFEVIDEPNIPTISGLHTFLVREKKEGTFAYGYKGYFHFNEIIKKQYDNLATGLKVYSLSKGSFKNIQIPLPPLPEQEAIAEALSDADAWIESLEQLIAKKRLIKQGAMQELLSPKEDWEVKNIKEITNNIIDYRGVTPKKLGMEWGNGNIVALSAGNVKKGYIDFNSECYFGSEELYKRWMRNGNPKKNDIVFTLEAPLGNVALLPNNDKYILSQRTILLQLSEKFNPNFIFQILLSNKFQNYILESATGSTAQGIKRQVFEKLLVTVPKSLTEQTCIATILSDMDAELEALEGQLRKARKVKQGMMQELLTGRVRLV